MSRETKDYVQSLRNGHDNQGPQINWTRGFNGEDNDADDFSSNNSQAQRSGRSDNNNQSSNPRWDEDADDSGWW